MEWTLRLVGTESDGQSQSFDVMPISRPDGLGEIAHLGLTLAEGKLLLAQGGYVVSRATMTAQVAVTCPSPGPALSPTAPPHALPNGPVPDLNSGKKW